MIEFGIKPAGATILLEWRPNLADGDEIDVFTVAAIAPATVTVSDDAATATEAAFRVSGGDVGEIAYLSLEATTANGDTLVDVGRIIIVDEAAGEIITAGELRTELRDCADDDAALLTLIKDAREFVEAETGRATIAREVVQVMDGWPAGHVSEWWDGVRDGAISANAPNFVELNTRPALSITKIETLNEAGEASTWAPSNYILENRGDVHRVILKPGSSWPTAGLPAGGVAITYQAGYSDPSQVPGLFKRAVRQIAAHWYENRELATSEGVNKIPMMAASIIEKLKERRI